MLAVGLCTEGAAAFSEREFVARLCRMHVKGMDPQSQAADDSDAFDWTAFGASVSKLFAQAPTMSFMCVHAHLPLPAPRLRLTVFEK